MCLSRLAQADVLVTVGDALRVWKLAGGGAAGGKVAKTLKEARQPPSSKHLVQQLIMWNC